MDEIDAVIEPAKVEKGDVFTWGEINLEIYRAAKDGTWADACVRTGNGGWWTKRLRLPLSSDYVLAAESVRKR